MKIEMLKTSAVIPYERNAMKHSDFQVEKLANSLREFGFQQPLVIDKNNVLVVGHGRLAAAKLLKMKEVPCVRASELTEEQIKAYRVADNQLGSLGEIDLDLLNSELDSIGELNMEDFGFSFDDEEEEEEKWIDTRHPSCQHNVFENQERRQFATESFYGMPPMSPTDTTGDKMIRFMDWKECENPKEYIAHFFYDDYKFMNAWRDPDKYLDRLREFKAVISPNFSVYTDFPRALQILACYRRQWCGAFWQEQGIDVIPGIVWGDEESYDYCFDGVPKGGTVCVSTLSIPNDKDWDGEDGLYMKGYNEMMKRIQPKTVMVYGKMLKTLYGNIIRIPAYYEEKFEIRRKNGTEK